MANVDWQQLLRRSNQWFDRMVAALQLKDRADRQRELDKIEAELKALKNSTTEFLTAPKVVADPHKEIGKKIGDILIVRLMPAFQKAQNAYDRSQQLHRNVRIAFALAAYHTDNNRYPAKLDGLAPKYLRAVQDDLFSGKPLIYRVTDKGYLFYSVGVNSKDEDGRSFDDDPAGDDLPVRMPLPERKGKK